MRLLALIITGALNSPSVELRVLAASLLSAIIRVGELGLSLDLLLEGLRCYRLRGAIRGGSKEGKGEFLS